MRNTLLWLLLLLGLYSPANASISEYKQWTDEALAAGDWNQAYPFALRLYEDSPGDAQAALSMARVYLGLDAPAAAIETIRATLRLGVEGEDSLKLKVLLAKAHEEVGEFAIAWNLYRQIVNEATAGDPLIEIVKKSRWYSWAGALGAMNRDSRDQRFQKEYEDNPNDEAAAYHFFQVLFEYDRKGEYSLNLLRKYLEEGRAIPLSVMEIAVDKNKTATLYTSSKVEKKALFDESRSWIQSMRESGYDALLADTAENEIDALEADMAGEWDGEYRSPLDGFWDVDGRMREEADILVAQYTQKIDAARVQLDEINQLLQALEKVSTDAVVPDDLNGFLDESRMNIILLPIQTGEHLKAMWDSARQLQALSAGLSEGARYAEDWQAEAYQENLNKISPLVSNAESTHREVWEGLEALPEAWRSLQIALRKKQWWEDIAKSSNPETILSATDGLLLAKEKGPALWNARFQALKAMSSMEEAAFAAANLILSTQTDAATPDELQAAAKAEQWLEARIDLSDRYAAEAEAAIDNDDLETATQKLAEALPLCPFGTNTLYQQYRLAVRTQNDFEADRVLAAWWMSGGKLGTKDTTPLMQVAANASDWTLLMSLVKESLRTNPYNTDAWYFQMIASIAFGQYERFNEAHEILTTSIHHLEAPVGKAVFGLNEATVTNKVDAFLDAVEGNYEGRKGEKIGQSLRAAYIALRSGVSAEKLEDLMKAAMNPSEPLIARAAAHGIYNSKRLKDNPELLNIPMKAEDPVYLPSKDTWSKKIDRSLKAGQLIEVAGDLDFSEMPYASAMRLRGVGLNANIHWEEKGYDRGFKFRKSLVEIEGMRIGGVGESFALTVQAGSVLRLKGVETNFADLMVKGSLALSSMDMKSSVDSDRNSSISVKDCALSAKNVKETSRSFKANGRAALEGVFISSFQDPSLSVGDGAVLICEDLMFQGTERRFEKKKAISLAANSLLDLRNSTLVGLQSGDIDLRDGSAQLRGTRSVVYGSTNSISKSWMGQGIRQEALTLYDTASKVIVSTIDELRQAVEKATPGDVIYIKAGEYKLDNPALLIPNGVHLVGEVTKENRTIIKPRIRLQEYSEKGIIASGGGAIALTDLDIDVQFERKYMMGGTAFNVQDTSERDVLTANGSLIITRNCYLGNGSGNYNEFVLEDGGRALATSTFSKGFIIGLKVQADTQFYSLGNNSTLSLHGPGKLFFAGARNSKLVARTKGTSLIGDERLKSYNLGTGTDDSPSTIRYVIAQEYRDSQWKTLTKEYLEKMESLSALECAELTKAVSEEFVKIAQLAGTRESETKEHFMNLILGFINENPKKAGAVLTQVNMGAFDMTLINTKLTSRTKDEVKRFATIVLDGAYKKSLSEWLTIYNSGMRFRDYEAAQQRASESKHVVTGKPNIVTANNYWNPNQATNTNPNWDRYMNREPTWPSFTPNTSGWSAPDNTWTPSSDNQMQTYRQNLDRQINRALGGY